MDWKDPAIIPMPWRDHQAVELKELCVALFTDNGDITRLLQLTAA